MTSAGLHTARPGQSRRNGLAPPELSRRYFEVVGTPEQDKNWVVTLGSHFVPRDVLIRETLGWLDRYQGRPGGWGHR
jgi:hypothetical protein